MKEPKPGLLDHIIQKHIVRKLLSAGKAKFSELRPDRVESNLFMYHLNLLIKRGVVEKNDGQYVLSAAGGAFVDRANLDKLEFRVQPKIVTILAITSASGKWLLLERLHEPHMNRIGFPSGKLHYGETLEHAAVRELDEKTGITGVKLKLAGNVAMRFMDKDKEVTVNHTLGYVFTATAAEESGLVNKSTYWRSFWGTEADLITGNVFKGHPDILKLLASGKTFISSFDFVSDF